MRRLVAVDFQKEFASEGGKHYRPRPCHSFVKETLIPFLRQNDVKIAEIVSDYRLPRPADPNDCARPGEEGYISEIAGDVKLRNVWIKCMNSPIWIRDNIGNPNKEPGLPYQNPQAFTKWLEATVGKPEDVENIVLFGLTIDCCVFCTAQELSWRNYKVQILKEAVDTYSGDQKLKEMILNHLPLTRWASVITWSQFKQLTVSDSVKR